VGFLGEFMPAVVNFTPFCFHGMPTDAPTVGLDRGRVVVANAAARACGLEVGMPEATVRLKARDALIVPWHSVELDEAWREIVLALSEYSPCLEPLEPGLAMMDLKADEAAFIALTFNARVGVAATRELALLASLFAAVGEAVPVGDRAAFLGEVPFDHLSILGIDPAVISRLRWLGLRVVGELMAWSKQQLGAYFGVHRKTMLALLHGGSSLVARFRCPLEVRVEHVFDEVVHEPWEVDPALALMAARAFPHTLGKGIGRVGLLAFTPTGLRRGWDAPKQAIETPHMLERALTRALERSRAAVLGFDRLEVRLSELTGRGAMVGLFERPGAQVAVNAVGRRFPQALGRYREVQPFTQARGERFALEPWEA
jgi:protein ImuB